MLKFLWFLNTFCYFGHVMSSKKTNKNCVKIASKTALKSTPQLGSIFAPLWHNLGGFGRPRWGQDGTKSFQKLISKSIKKMITFRIALETNFERFGDPTWPPRGVTFVYKFKHLRFSGPSWAQDVPKTHPSPSKTLQDLSKRPSKTDFLPKFMDLGVDVGGCLYQLGMIFGIILR